MAYTLSFDLNLGLVGLTLEAQLIDTAGANVGAAVTTGFVEIGSGFYLFTHTTIPDGHRGGMKIQGVSGGTLRGFRSINPEESEPSVVWDVPLEGAFTGKQIVRLISAALAGQASGLEANAPVYKDIVGATKSRISAATDAFGNRSSVTLDVSDI